jgi:hypothetical protein
MAGILKVSINYSFFIETFCLFLSISMIFKTEMGCTFFCFAISSLLETLMIDSVSKGVSEGVFVACAKTAY